MIKTKFHDLFKTRLPIIQAGMGPYDTTKLAAAVALAGGLGLISTVGMGTFEMPSIGRFRYSAIFGEGPPEQLLTRSINDVMAVIGQSPGACFGVNIPVSEEFIPTAGRLIRCVMERVKSDPGAGERLRAIVTSAGDPFFRCGL